MKTLSNWRRAERGVASVEFALIALFVLFPLLFGIIEMGRVLFYWNTATELTRIGARVAVVCGFDASGIKTRIQAVYPLVADEEIEVNYLPAGCDPTNCLQVQVRISTSREVDGMTSFLPFSIPLPEFETTLPRESMKSDIDGSPNPLCT
jgi:Flp pilus assembly protein TadG